MALHEAALSSSVMHFSFSVSKSLLKLEIELSGQAKIFENLVLFSHSWTFILGHRKGRCTSHTKPAPKESSAQGVTIRHGAC